MSSIGKTKWGVQDTSASALFTFDTTKAGSGSTQLVLPFVSTGTYACTIKWGDGNSIYVNTWNDAALTHTYSVAGTYDVEIIGTCNGWRYNNSGDCAKLTNIKRWGKKFKVGNANGYFYGCANMVITATDTLNTAGMTNMSYMFMGCTVFNQSVLNFDTSKVTLMSYMFYNCTAFNQSVSNFNTANVTDMAYMFLGCAVFNQSVSNFDTTKVTNMIYMFYGCAAFNQSVSNFNTTNVTSMSYVFYGCAIFNQSVSNFNTAKVTTMIDMFRGCTAFNQSVSNFNTTNVTDMSFMFRDCTVFNQSISNFNTAKVTTMKNMFRSCTAFNQDISSWNIQLVTTMEDMFLSNNAALSTANYDALLIAWAAESVKSSVPLHAGTTKYTGGGAAAAARAVLTGTYGWTITDGGTV